MKQIDRHAVANRLWRSAADLRRRLAGRGSATSALASFGSPGRSDIERWNRLTAVGHDAYRVDHPITPGRVAVVCVSMRPDLLRAAAANMTCQDHRETELIFVANSDGFDLGAVESVLGCGHPARVLQAKRGSSLGAALNLGLSATDARFVAKFDDDDTYGPRYLSDALRAHGYAGAGVVGKHTYYVHFDANDETMLRFPGREFRYSGTLAGGTLVIDRDSVDDQRFDDISLGEDRAFLARCHRRGISTFSADRFNYLLARTGRNTWVADDATFRAQALPVTDQAAVIR